MALFDFLSRNKVEQLVKEPSHYQEKRIGTIEIPEKLTERNAFILANTVSEIYFGIDFHADRASKLRYYIADKSGNEIPNTELSRFVLNINPLFSFSDLVYQYVFSYLSDGNAITYTQSPSLYKKPSVNNISRVDILQPNLFEVSEFYNISILSANSLNDIIKRARYTYSNSMYDLLNIDMLHVDNIDATRRNYSMVLSKSPLFKCLRSINNLLATYSARYNIYVNNGAAGYLVKKETSGQNSVQNIVDPRGRQDILDDIKNRNGLTGNRNLWGISGIPIEFINTLSDIQKLMPFEETLEDSIKIASIYQIPPDLIPRKDQSTFNNQGESERKVWENALISMVNTFCQNYTKNITLDKVGYQVKADYSTVSYLKANESTIEDVNAKKLTNLNTIKTIDPSKEKEVNAEIDKIMLTYGNR